MVFVAAADLHTAAKHDGAFEACPKHKCVHLRESADPPRSMQSYPCRVPVPKAELARLGVQADDVVVVETVR